MKWPWHRFHDHMHQPVATSQNPARPASLLISEPVLPSTNVLLRCWCGDVISKRLEGTWTIAELMGLGSEADAVRAELARRHSAGEPPDFAQSMWETRGISDWWPAGGLVGVAQSVPVAETAGEPPWGNAAACSTPGCIRVAGHEIPDGCVVSQSRLGWEQERDRLRAEQPEVCPRCGSTNRGIAHLVGSGSYVCTDVWHGSGMVLVQPRDEHPDVTAEGGEPVVVTRDELTAEYDLRHGIPNPVNDNSHPPADGGVSIPQALRDATVTVAEARRAAEAFGAAMHRVTAEDEPVGDRCVRCGRLAVLSPSAPCPECSDYQAAQPDAAQPARRACVDAACIRPGLHYVPEDCRFAGTKPGEVRDAGGNWRAGHP